MKASDLRAYAKNKDGIESKQKTAQKSGRMKTI